MAVLVLAVSSVSVWAAADRVAAVPVAELPPELVSADIEMRLAAIPPLIRQANRKAIGWLGAAALFDPDGRVRREAVVALGEIGKPLALQTLEQSLLDAEPLVREAAIEALVEIGGDQAAVSLRLALNDREPSLREEAMVAAAEIGGPIAIAILRQGLRDKHPAVREIAIEELLDLGARDPDRKDPDRSGSD